MQYKLRNLQPQGWRNRCGRHLLHFILAWRVHRGLDGQVQQITYLKASHENSIERVQHIAV